MRRACVRTCVREFCRGPGSRAGMGAAFGLVLCFFVFFYPGLDETHPAPKQDPSKCKVTSKTNDRLEALIMIIINVVVRDARLMKTFPLMRSSNT